MPLLILIALFILLFMCLGFNMVDEHFKAIRKQLGEPPTPQSQDDDA